MTRQTSNATIAAHVRGLLDKSGLSVPQAAKLAGLSKQTAYNILQGRGKGCTVAALVELLKVLNAEITISAKQ